MVVVKWGLRLLVAFVLLVLALVGWIIFRYQTSQPKVSGELDVAQLVGEAQILRDQYGIPHITGPNDAAVNFGIGFVHAQDRFFAMDIMRRSVHGELSELVGKIALPLDQKARAFRYENLIQAQLANLTPENLAALEAYSAGVNAALKAGPIAPEYALLFAKPRPWTVEDSVACSIALIVDQVTGIDEDLSRLRYQKILTPEQWKQYNPAYPDWAPLTIPAPLTPTPSVPGKPDAAKAKGAPQRPQPLGQKVPGSNAWAVTGARSNTGMPLLAGDPHVDLGAPATFYLVHLRYAQGDVVGASLPGTPLVVMGRGPHSAWAITNGAIDAQDLVAVSPAEVATYSKRTETILVRQLFGMKRVRVEFADSPDGPVIDPAIFPNAVLSGDVKTVFKTAALDEANRPFDAMRAVQFGRSAADTLRAAQLLRAPALNLTTAYDNGDIAFALSGALPMRDETGKWIGTLPEEARPFVANPGTGFIANANNRQTDNPAIVGSFSASRAAKLVERLGQQNVHDLASFQSIQGDVAPTSVARLLVALRDATPASEQGKALLTQLLAWDGAMRADAREPLLWAHYYRILAQALYGDEIQRDKLGWISPILVDAILRGSDAAWCDNVGTKEAVETCAQTMGAALDKAAANPPPPGNWGQAHAMMFAHPLLSKFPILKGMYVVRQEVGGDNDSLQSTHYAPTGSDAGDFHSDFGSGFRAIYDLADLNRSHFVIAPGQSGHPLSPHFGDLAPLWAKAEGVEVRADVDFANPPANMRKLTLRGAKSGR